MKCEKCGDELARRRNRIFSKVENGMCGECVMEERESELLVGYDEYNG